MAGPHSDEFMSLTQKNISLARENCQMSEEIEELQRRLRQRAYGGGATYGHVGAVALCSGCDELERRNTELEQRNTELERRNAELERRNAIPDIER